MPQEIPESRVPFKQDGNPLPSGRPTLRWTHRAEQVVRWTHNSSDGVHLEETPRDTERHREREAPLSSPAPSSWRLSSASHENLLLLLLLLLLLRLLYQVVKARKKERKKAMERKMFHHHRLGVRDANVEAEKYSCSNMS